MNRQQTLEFMQEENPNIDREATRLLGNILDFGMIEFSKGRMTEEQVHDFYSFVLQDVINVPMEIIETFMVDD